MFRLLLALSFGFLYAISFGESLPARKVTSVSSYELALAGATSPPYPKQTARACGKQLETRAASNQQLCKKLLSEYMYLNRKIDRVKNTVQGVTNRIHRARVSCYYRATNWDARSDKPIMFLDRQNVDCPRPYFLAKFRLGREGNYNSARVRYSYRCCKFVL